MPETNARVGTSRARPRRRARFPLRLTSRYRGFFLADFLQTLQVPTPEGPRHLGHPTVPQFSQRSRCPFVDLHVTQGSRTVQLAIDPLLLNRQGLRFKRRLPDPIAQLPTS